MKKSKTVTSKQNAETTARMALSAIFYLLSVIFLAACTDDDEPSAPLGDSPITATATIPGNLWGATTRLVTETYSDLTLHYTNEKGVASTFSVPAENVSLSAGNDYTISFTTQAGGDSVQLLWAQVDATQPIYLTCINVENGPGRERWFNTLHTSVPSAKVAEELAFAMPMKPTASKLTIKVIIDGDMSDDAMMAELLARPFAIRDYDPMIDGNISPAYSEAYTQLIQLYSEDNVFTGMLLLPQQDVARQIHIRYGSSVWSIDLGTVPVTGGLTGQMANQLVAGQHLTLNLTVSLADPDNPVFTIDAFV